MLNLPVAMIKEILSFVLPIILLSPLTPFLPTVEVTAPKEGQAVQGSVTISGSVSGDDFMSGDISYGYDSDGNSTWFFISTVSQPVANGVLAVWDTSTISDGNYQLKITAKYKNGDTKEVIIQHLLVRNYTAIQSTDTEPPEVSEKENVVVSTVTETPVFSATPFPTNSGSLKVSQIQDSLQWGGILGIVCLLFIGLIVLFRWIKFNR
jgi:hypothetical protein